MSFRRLRYAGLLLAALAAACAGPEVAMKRSFDFTKVRRVAVLGFSGSGGDAAADMMAQALLSQGADVVERRQLDAVLKENHLEATGALDPGTIREFGRLLGVDALFFGTVNSYSPPQSYLVFGGSGRNTPSVSNLSSGYVYSQGPAPGVEGADVITSAATVGLTARMVEVQSGSILWSASQTYEGIDIDSALRVVTAGFADSLREAWLSRLR